MAASLINTLKSRISIRYGMRLYFLLNIIIIMCIGGVFPLTSNEIFVFFSEKFSALQVLEVYFIWIIIGRLDKNFSISFIELMTSTVITLTVLILLFRRPEYALAFHSIYISLRWIKIARVNLEALSLAAFALQYAGAFGPLFRLHTYFAYVDAASIRFLLSLAGFYTDGSGTLLHYGPTGALLNINAGCTSTLAIIYGLSGAAIFIIYRKAKLTTMLILSVAALLLTILIMNWLRIALMIESYTAYQFWHEGTGMQIVSLLNAVAILAWIHIGQSRTDFHNLSTIDQQAKF